MRIVTRLRMFSAAATLALVVLAPVFIWSLSEFRQAKSDYSLANAIKLNFFERASLRDQYFLYREDRLRVQWERNKASADGLLQRGQAQFQGEDDRRTLARLRSEIEATARIFHRIVDNTEVLERAAGNRPVYEEHDKRLYSQLLLKAYAVRETATALEDAAARRVEQAYRLLTVIAGLFAVTLALVAILISTQIGRLIRRRLVPLHKGAETIANGDLDFRIQAEGADEFTDLAVSINTMTEKLQVFTRRLEAEIAAHEQAETALRTSQETLRERNTLLENVINSSTDYIFVKDRDLHTVLCNTVFARALGKTPAELYGRTDIENGWSADLVLGNPDKGIRGFRQDDLAALDGEKVHANTDLGNVGDEIRTFDSIKVPLRSAEGEIIGLLGISRDVTESRKAEEKLRLAASVFTHAREGIMITAADGTIIEVNDTFSRITGYGRNEVLGRNPRLLSSGRHGKEFYAALWRDLSEKGHWYGEVWNRRKNGEVFAEMLTIGAVRDAQGDIRQYVALFSDITPIKEHEQQLEHVAHYDALTTLPNRVLLADRLRQAMVQAQRRQQRLAVAYLDLDGFKAINDSHGHEAGDQLLLALSSRMKQALREGDTLARLGGDEFVAVLLDLADIDAGVPMLARLLAAAAQPLRVGEHVLQVSASIGVAFYPQTEEVEADQLLRQADQAMYQAKLAGKNRYHIFDAGQDRNVRGHHESLEHIRRGLSEGEFVLYYQPKVNMRTGTVVGAEALIRWRHPEKGLLLPAMFLPVIEEHPLAIELGEWVIDSALVQMERWQAAGLDIPVSVNVGARQLQQADFVQRLGGILAAHPDIRPGDLELEVLETSALEDLARASQVIQACRAIGVMFALDDFGTGYSSLTYLKRLPVAILKIDRSFVCDMLDDPEDLAILEGVIGLSAAFRCQVIAEGVETVEHGEMLLRLGCELAQGYGIAHPMPADALPGWAHTWRPDPAWVDQGPISHDDLPVLIAGVEQRSWVMAVESFITGGRDTPPSLDSHTCRFGVWLDGEGRARHGAQPAFQAIEPLHRQVHALAVESCRLRDLGRDEAARARLVELRELRDSLLGQLKVLARGG